MIYFSLKKESENMKKKYEIKLSTEEKIYLTNIVKKGSEKARKITRSQILLLCDKDTMTQEEICAALSITSNTIRHVCERYLNEGLESALQEKPRSGAPTIFDGKCKANITALACSKPPEGYSQWSLRLLADKAVELGFVEEISHTDVGRILKKTK
jgi:transposase